MTSCAATTSDRASMDRRGWRRRTGDTVRIPFLLVVRAEDRVDLFGVEAVVMVAQVVANEHLALFGEDASHLPLAQAPEHRDDLCAIGRPVVVDGTRLEHTHFFL